MPGRLWTGRSRTNRSMSVTFHRTIRPLLPRRTGAGSSPVAVQRQTVRKPTPNRSATSLAVKRCRACTLMAMTLARFGTPSAMAGNRRRVRSTEVYNNVRLYRFPAYFEMSVDGHSGALSGTDWHYRLRSPLPFLGRAFIPVSVRKGANGPSYPGR